MAPRGDGTVEYVGNNVLSDANRPMWLTAGAALAGGLVQVLALGEMLEPSWTWTFGLPVFLDVNGLLTQTPPVAPAATFIRQLAGPSRTPTAMFYAPREPILLA